MLRAFIKLLKFLLIFTFYFLVNFIIYGILPFFMFLLLLKDLLKEFSIAWFNFILLDVIVDLIVPVVIWSLRPFTYLLGRLCNGVLIIMEHLCLLYFLFWEGWLVKYKGIVLVLVHILFIFVWCFLYVKFLFFWYDGLCLCCEKWGIFHCSQMFVPLSIVTVLFLEVRRCFRVYLAKKILLMEIEKEALKTKSKNDV